MRALADLRAKGAVTQEELPRPGKPKVLRLSIPLAQNRESVVQEAKIFCANPLAQNPPLGTNPPEGVGGDGNPFQEGPRLSRTPIAESPSSSQVPQEEPEVEL